MLDSLKTIFAGPNASDAAFDPSILGDPVALRTAWHPANPGGASFGTHRLRQTSSLRFEFAPTTAWKLFTGVFIVVGIGIVGFQLPRVDLDQIARSAQHAIVPLLVGCVFTGAGVTMAWLGGTPRVFDKAASMFWRGRKAPAIGMAGDGRSTPLSAIHALQLVSEYVSGNKNAYYSYELNLVLADGNRINVVDHGHLDQLRQDAEALARFLDKPLWDAT